MGIFALVTTLLVGLITMSGNWIRRTNARQDSQQDLLVAANQIARTLAQAPAGSVLLQYPSGTPATGDLILSFQTAQDATGAYFEDPNTFEPSYQGYTVIYWDAGSRRLLQAFLPQPPTTTIAPANAAAVLAARNPASDRALASDVDRFTALDPSDDSPTALVTNPFRFRLEVGQAKRDQVVSLEAVRSVRLYR